MVTFAVKLNRGALCQAGAPGTEVDSTALQHSWLAGVSLGCSHQHTDPVEGKGEAVQGDSQLFSSLLRQEGPRRLGQRLAGGGVDAPWVVFISQKMPQMPEARAGVRRSPCAAVTNTSPPLLLPLSLFSYLPPVIKERRSQSQFWEGEERPEVLAPASPSPLWTCQDWVHSLGTQGPLTQPVPSRPKPKPFSGPRPRHPAAQPWGV